MLLKRPLILSQLQPGSSLSSGWRISARTSRYDAPSSECVFNGHLQCPQLLQKKTGAPKAAMIIANGQLRIRLASDISGMSHSEQFSFSSITAPRFISRVSSSRQLVHHSFDKLLAQAVMPDSFICLPFRPEPSECHCFQTDCLSLQTKMAASYPTAL